MTCVTRRAVLKQLAKSTDAERRESTTVEALASALGADEQTLTEHIDVLVACELAHVDADGGVRATITGEELLALDTDGPAIIDLAGHSDDTDT